MPHACHKNVSSQNSFVFKMINIWWFDTWTWPSGIAVGACLRLNLPCLLLWIHHYNSWHKCITIYTVSSNSNMGQISHNVLITSELQSLLSNPHYRPPLNTTIWLTGCQLVSGWSQLNLKIDSKSLSLSKCSIISHMPTFACSGEFWHLI